MVVPVPDAEAPWTIVTQVYRYPYATVNALWAGIRWLDAVPTRVVLFTPDEEDASSRQVVAGVEVLLARLHEQRDGEGEAPELEVRVDDPEDAQDTLKATKAIIEDVHEAGGRVAVDLTPGRTIPKAALLGACHQEPPDHILYLSVDDYDYRPEPYVLLPFRKQRVVDLQAMLQGVGRDG